MITRLLGYIRRLKNPAFASVALAVFSLLSLFLYPCFLPSRSYADTPEVTPSITIGSSGTLAFSIDPGQFNHGSQDITVLTTNYTGYTLTAVPSSNDSRLTNTATATPSYITSIASDSTSSNFSSAEYGFSTDSTITSSTTYHPVTTSTEIKRTNSATTTAQAGTFQFTIGAKAGSNAPAGTYSRTFTMTASANAVAYAVTYVENAGQDTVSNMPNPNPQTTGTVVGTTLTLAANIPTRTGYKFLGWATTSSATEPTYQPGGSYSLDQTTGNIATLYAVWAEPLQGWNNCSSLNIGDTIQLYDTRDNQLYKVSKYKMSSNGSKTACWMSNLNLGATAFASDVTQLDSTNSNMPTASAIPTSTFNSWNRIYETSSYTSPALTPITTSNTPSYTDTDTYGNKYGTLYNYAAASANTINAPEGENNYNASNSLCPKGWRLPTGGSSGELKQLLTDGYSVTSSAEGSTFMQQDLGFSLAGYISYGSPISQNTVGRYWSSTKYNNNQMYMLESTSTLVLPQYKRVRDGGYSIRCIKQSTTHTLTVSYGTGVAGVTIDGIAVANGATVEMEEGVSHNINMTFDSGYEFDSWSATSGTLGSASTQSTTYTIGSSNATLTASAKFSGLTVNYHGNGLTFNNTDTDHTTLYDNNCADQPIASPQYSHTANISDAGVQSGNYADNLASKDVVSITGAVNLRAEISYGTENNWDMLYVFKGEYTGEVTRHMEAGQLQKYMGGDNTPTTVTITIPGDTATFAFYSDSGTGFYGYYAVITAVDANGDPITGDVTVCTRTLHTGSTFVAPDVASNQRFYGWSENSSATTADYVSENDIKKNLPGVGSTVKDLYAVWVPTYKIQYSINGGDAGTMGDFSGLAVGESTTLYPSNFSRSGYGFAGWNTASDGSGTNLGPSETITLDNTLASVADSNRIITLYAKWLASAGNLQSFNCNNLASGAVTALTDTRDSQTYAVAKLADGNCWMIENLRLDTANSQGSSNIAKAQGYGTNFSGLANPETEAFENSVVSNSLYSTSIITGDNQGYRFPRYSNINTANRDQYTTNTSAKTYSFGNFYTWSAATANIGDYPTSGTVVPFTSICPYGWKLPYGGNGTGVNGGNTKGGFYYLANQLSAATSSAANSNKFRKYPNNFLFSGYYNVGNYYTGGVYGDYWSATAQSATNAFGLYYSADGINSGSDSTSKAVGLTVRCLQSAPSHNLTVSYDTSKVASVTVDDIDVANGGKIVLEEGSSHNINMTFQSGYEFDNWSISGTGASVGSTSAQSTTVTIGSTDATLTATAKSSKTYMQNWSGCSSLAVGETVTLYDNRDEQAYTVGKLKMNAAGTSTACWMMENLNLGAQALVVSTLD
ncbi:InlB B-repeat-containing protein, partial [Candidatus Saccharibacteria bacterium]|nr:InlB B-repeat-containing protein [Candidatus Saccharibacteria bacterium]